MAPPPRRSRRLALKHVGIGDLPESALRRILLGPSDNLLRFVATCARVCVEWWRVVGGCAAYAHGLRGEERPRVLRVITQALGWGSSEVLRLRNGATFGGHKIGDAGAAALGAALLAMPASRPMSTFDISQAGVTAAGFTSLVPVLRRSWGGGGLKTIYVWGNPIGDAGVAALAGALPETVEDLSIYDTECGDDGFVALAAAMPRLTRMRVLGVGRNQHVGPAGFRAVAEALPAMPALREVSAQKLHGMGSEGASALAAAVPQCPRLQVLDLSQSDFDDQAKSQLRMLARPYDHPAGELQIDFIDH
eukprot:COSAG04_NODE_294_length_17734_cov_15.211568_9_plen_306_part_00